MGTRRQRAVDDPVTAYAKAVVSGEIVAGRLHRLTCERHLADLKTGRSRGLKWDQAAAVRVIEFFGHLRHFRGSEWAGKPFVLEPWQQFLVGSCFGWKRRWTDSGGKSQWVRRFVNAFCEFCRGQGKSTIAAGIALYGTFFDNEPGAASFCVATKRDQAKIVFETCKRMVLASPALKKRIAVQEYNLHSDASASRLEPLGADANTLDGLRPHIVIGDEVHAHKTSAVLDVMQTGMGTGRQPLMFEITTAGVGREGVWWKHRTYTIQILEGAAQDDAWFGFIACADPGDDWRQEPTWRKANPNYGKSVKPDKIANECRKAQAIPSYENTFRRLHCGQLVEQDVRWLQMDRWDACGGEIDEGDLAGQPCYAGLDLATTRDITAFVMAFPSDNGNVALMPRFWVPRDSADDRTRRDRVPYQQWIDAGFIKATDGTVTDYDTIREDIRELSERFQIQSIAYDRWNASQLVNQLMQDGANMVPVGQGFASMSAPSKELEKLMLAGQLRHGGHPVLRWMASNVATEEDAAGNIKPSKKKSGEKIDGIVASVMALSELVRGEPDAGESVYDTRGIAWIA